MIDWKGIIKNIKGGRKMYKITDNAKKDFIELMGYTPTDKEINKMLDESYCVQYFRKVIHVGKNYIIRPEVYFHLASELCFACDRYTRKIIAIYKAYKGVKPFKSALNNQSVIKAS